MKHKVKLWEWDDSRPFAFWPRPGDESGRQGDGGASHFESPWIGIWDKSTQSMVTIEQESRAPSSLG